SISLSRLGDLWHRRKTCLKDVLRHEFGHAVADTHRGLIRSRKFREAFGAPHTWDVQWTYDAWHHVSEYAATAPAEDFAEVFMMYLQFGGKLPAHFKTQAIRNKWKFIRELGSAISRGHRRWQ
ncbi:MAG: hypothetical protein ACOVMP_10645, partial [Chthoniobacterales bacterium]